MQCRSGEHMRKTMIMLLAVASVGISTAPATALPSGAKAFPNCSAVQKVYPHGIAKSTAAARTATGLKGTPKISASLYAANKSKDRDGDGVACEK